MESLLTPHPLRSLQPGQMLARNRDRMLGRERLLGLLDEGVERGLAVVVAGAGWGKTVLLRAWAESRLQADAAVIWLERSAQLADREAFLSSLLARFDERWGDGSSSSDGGARSRDHLIELVNQSASPVTVVVDASCDGADLWVLDELMALVERCQGLRAVFLAPSIHSAMSGPAWARIDPVVIAQSELAFTAEEVAAAASGYGLRLMPAASELLAEQTEGQPLGVRLVLNQLTLDGSAAADMDQMRRVIELAGNRRCARLAELLAGTSRLRFLLHCSIADVLTPGLVAAMGGDSDHADDLAWADAQGLLLRRPDGTRVFPAMVRRGLRGELQRVFPSEVSGLRRMVAECALELGDIVATLAEALDLGDWELVDQVVKRHTTAALHRHREQLRSVLHRIPPDELTTRPALALAYLLSLHVDEPPAPARLRAVARAAGRLDREQGARQSSDTSEVWVVACRMGFERLAGRYVSAARAADALLVSLGSTPETAARYEGAFSMMRIESGISYALAGRLADAAQIFAAEMRSERRVSWQRSHAASLLACVYALHGDMRACEQVVRELRVQQAPPKWGGSAAALAYELAEALLSLEQFDVDAAERRLHSLGEERSLVEYLPLVVRIESLISLARHGVDGFLDRDSGELHDSRLFRSVGPFGALQSIGRADLLLSRNYRERARAVLEEWQPHPDRTALALARVALAENRLGEVSELLDRPVWATEEEPRNRAEALLLNAVALQRSGCEAEARTSIERALLVLEEYGLRRPLMMAPHDELRALLIALGEWRGAPAVELLDGVPDVFSGLAQTEPLSEREQAVLHALTRISATENVAAHLFVSPNTVKTQIRSIYRKLGVTSREQALMVARERGLIAPRSRLQA